MRVDGQMRILSEQYSRPGKGAVALIPADDATGLNLRGPRRGWEQAQSLLHPPLGGHIDDH